jgi:hypothetical protein
MRQQGRPGISGLRVHRGGRWRLSELPPLLPRRREVATPGVVGVQARAEEGQARMEPRLIIINKELASPTTS